MPSQKPQQLDGVGRARMQRAQALHRDGNLAAAILEYQGLLSGVPEDFEANLYCGAAQARIGELEQALSRLRAAVRIAPLHAIARFELANAMRLAGQLADSITEFSTALRLDPSLADAPCGRATARLAQGHAEDAIADFDLALRIRPGFPIAMNGRAVALRQLGRATEALACIDTLLTAHPGFSEAHNNRGLILRDLGQPDLAVDSFNRALAGNPRLVDALNNRATVLLALRRPGEALQSIDAALSLAPPSAGHLVNRANALRDLYRRDEALQCCEQALRVDPAFAGAHVARANILVHQNRAEAALESLAVALELEPGMPEALAGMAEAQRRLQKHAAALESITRALDARPRDARFLALRGGIQLDLGNAEDCIASCDLALRHWPRLPLALHERVKALVHLNRRGDAVDSIMLLVEVAPDFDYALGNALDVRRTSCVWPGYDDLAQRAIDAVRSEQRVSSPWSFLSVCDDPALQLRCARRYVADTIGEDNQPREAALARNGRRLRVAYMSADFREHPVAHVSVGLFEQHDRQHFETYALSLVECEHRTPTRERLEKAFEHFVEVRGSDAEVAALVRELEIDVLVDLTCHTAHGRPGVFQKRPAPVQVNFIGYAGTSGSPCYDYLIADHTVVPEGDEVHYAEKIARMPHCYLPYDDRQPISDTGMTRAEAGLPERGFVFATFNNIYKYTPTLFDDWMRILRAVPGSVLWMRAEHEIIEDNLRREAAARGVGRERIIMAPRVADRATHLARHKLADLILDSYPYNGHSTTADALWSGAPVIACLGKSFAARVSASMLRSVGLPELVANDREDFIRLGVSLAADRDRLAAIRNRLGVARRELPLFATAQFCAALESGYVHMIERAREGLPPDHLAIATA